MSVRIRAVRGCEPVEFKLPSLEAATAVALEALVRHPFVEAGAYDFRYAIDACEVRLDVVVGDGGSVREYSSGRLGAEIMYDKYIQDPKEEVELRLHLRCYLGEAVEPHPEEIPAAEKLVRRPVELAGLRRTLWHEYAHLLDAIRWDFRYDLAAKKALSAYERAVLNELWNAYIDRRLSCLVPEADRNFFMPPEGYTRAALQATLRSIWAEPREWTYRELVGAAIRMPSR